MKCRIKSNYRMFLSSDGVDPDLVIILLLSATFTSILFQPLKMFFSGSLKACTPVLLLSLSFLKHCCYGCSSDPFFPPKYVPVSMAAK